ncbi:MAG: GAF domain-containing protein, partial [Pseudonocardiales bacterium]|nr:GAF domain-containing protein [Pseudonocardiales bacterium]
MAGRTVGPGDEATPHLRALVDGLSAVVWEADAASVAFTFVSDRAEDLLGYPAAAWIGDPDFWPSMIHPDERATVVAHCAAETAAGRDHDLSFRAVAADGRTVWLHDVVHVICDDDGTPRRLQGVMIDVTVQKRAERASALLAEAGRVLSGPAAFGERLAALARLTTGPMGDCTLVSCPDRDGRYRPVAVAHRDPELEPLLADAAHAAPPASVRAALARGEPFVVPEIPDEVRHEDDPPADVAAARDRLRSGAALVVPLAAGGTQLGLLTFATRDRSRVYDDADLELARRLGEQLAVAMETDRLRERNRRLFAVTSALAAAASTPEACTAVVRSTQDALRARYVSVYRLVGDRLHAVHRAGHPEELDLSAFAAVELGAPLPLTDAVRTGRSLWIDTLSELRRRYPHVVDAAAATGIRALAVLPMRVAGGVNGALTLSFDRDHVSTPEDREFARLL